MFSTGPGLFDRHCAGGLRVKSTTRTPLPCRIPYRTLLGPAPKSSPRSARPAASRSRLPNWCGPASTCSASTWPTAAWPSTKPRPRRFRQVSRELNRPIGVLVDLAGPKIRLGELPGGRSIASWEPSFASCAATVATQPTSSTATYEPLIDELNVGDTVMLADGTVGMIVIEEARQTRARCRVVQPGIDPQPPGAEPAGREAERAGHGRRRSRATPCGPPRTTSTSSA